VTFPCYGRALALTSEPSLIMPPRWKRGCTPTTTRTAVTTCLQTDVFVCCDRADLAGQLSLIAVGSPPDGHTGGTAQAHGGVVLSDDRVWSEPPVVPKILRGTSLYASGVSSVRP
jgi:hypothetical protein